MKQWLPLVFLVFLPSLWGEDLSIGPEDVRIDLSTEGGYHLRVRKKPEMSSILLTESTEDPLKKADTFAYRTGIYNAINGDEQRILNGQVLKREGMYFLVDSTPTPDTEFGEAFHIFIPYILEYGYPWSRQGEVMVLDGTYLSIRAFSKPFADYTGAFKDNPFILRISQQPLEGPKEDNFMPDTVREFSKLADDTEGESIKTLGQEDMIEQIKKIVDKQKGRTLDLVIALDTTQSMHDDIPYIRKLLVPMLSERIKRFDDFRIGLVLYRDYMEEYLNRTSPFIKDLAAFQRAIDSVRVAGGRDIPEAVHEALYAGIHKFDWKAESRIIILIGDAPPHPRPRGAVTEEMVINDARTKDITLFSIILPQ
jgi:hypothetical protein